MTHRHCLLPALAACLATAVHSAAAAPAPAYIALGDSYAYGFTTTQTLITDALSSNTAALTGYQGYVKPYSQFLGLPEASVFNLAIPGETLNSFLSGGNKGSLANLNYGGSTTLSQSALLTKTLTNLGGSVQNITIQLGGNDLLGLALSPTFAAAGSATQPTTLTVTQQSLITTALGAFNASYVPVLQQLKSASPNVSVIGYFDPFTPLDTGKYATSDPFHGLAATLLPELNASLQADAALAGVRYVDIAGAFQGQETTLSEDTQPLDQSLLEPYLPGYKPSLPDSFPDYHPNAAGYGVIAHQLEAVPEGSTWALLSLGLPLLGLAVRRRVCLK